MAFESPEGIYEGMDMTTTAGMYNITASDYDSNIFFPGSQRVGLADEENGRMVNRDRYHVQRICNVHYVL